MLYLFWTWSYNGSCAYFGNSTQTYVHPHQREALAETETFWMIWLNIGLSWKITKIRSTPLFFKIDLCSATSTESSRRDLLNDMAEHRPILKNNQNTLYSLIFQDRPTVCSATSIENSRRDLLNDMAEHRPVLKNNHYACQPRFGFTLPKQV